MPASDAHVPTTRAARYLAQLCRHGSLMGQRALRRAHGRAGGGAPPAVRHAGQAGTEGVIDFGWGRCTMRASTEELMLRAEAGDQQQLEQIQDGISARLEHIGRRDQLTVAWTPARDQ